MKSSINYSKYNGGLIYLTTLVDNNGIFAYIFNPSERRLNFPYCPSVYMNV